MARLTQDKTAAAFDKRIEVLEHEVDQCDKAIESAESQRRIALHKLAELQSLRAELLDDATDEEGGE